MLTYARCSTDAKADGASDDAEKEASEAIQWFANPGEEVKQKTIPVYCMGVGDSFDASVIEYFGRMTRACCAPKIQSDDFIQTSNESVSAVLDKGVCAIVSDQVCATFILSADAFEKGARFYKPNETDITSNLDRIEDVLFVEVRPFTKRRAGHRKIVERATESSGAPIELPFAESPRLKRVSPAGYDRYCI
jgi:hypothetical protein